jgi:hypothetical protein
MSEHDKPTHSPSGQHPAVREYRRKLDSIDNGVSAAQTELDRKLSEYLDDLKTPPAAQPLSKLPGPR